MSRTYSDATSRWAGMGPYYAMFPVEFSDFVVARYTNPGDAVLDPFSGRGTALFSASTQSREAIGIELNPVGYVYSKAKLEPAPYADVLARLCEIQAVADAFADEAQRLPRFFHACYSRKVRRFLSAARARLDWRRRTADRTAMAILLVYLHGKLGSALSNQMRQTKAMSPGYSMRWWAERKMAPPDVDPVPFLMRRLNWRYAHGTPEGLRGRVYLGDSRCLLGRVAKLVRDQQVRQPRLLFTSPPYRGITNYHYDQWLRLWLLGGPPDALLHGRGHRGKLEDPNQYEALLRAVFAKAAQVMAKDAIVYVRTDRREFTRTTTRKVLQECFPNKRLVEQGRPVQGRTQTHLFGSSNSPREGGGEVDLILQP